MKAASSLQAQQRCLGPSLLFIDTDAVQAAQGAGGYRNGQVAIIALVAAAQLLTRHGSVMVVCFYSAMAEELRECCAGMMAAYGSLLSARGEPRLCVGTVASLQGREADAVIIAFERSAKLPNPSGEVAFCVDVRLIAVMLSRARLHLCLVGPSPRFYL